MYKCKPLANNYWIFAFSPLVVIFTRKSRLKFWLVLNEVVSPSYANRWRVAFAQQLVGHIFYVREPRMEYAYIQLNNILNNRFLFQIRKLTRVSWNIASCRPAIASGGECYWRYVINCSYVSKSKLWIVFKSLNCKSKP